MATPASLTEPQPGPAEPPPAPQERRTSRKRRKHWTWKRWLANIMIICGVLFLPAYFLSTCAYTYVHQQGLGHDLEAASPQITTAQAALSSTEDFIPMDIRSATVTDAAATAAQIAAAKAAEAERQAQLAAFKASADAFQAQVGGHTGEPIGRIIIPSIGVDVVMVEGTSKRDLKEGPGHWSETPFPGQGGNFVVSGHRTTYGAPFFKLNEVKPGDEIDLVLPYAVARYTVTDVVIVYPDQVDTVRQRGREQVSLAACHPIYSAKQRIVVQGDLTSFKLISSEG